MSEWSSVGAISANVHATSFQGSSLNIARMLNLPIEAIDHFMKQHLELTSPFPLTSDLRLSKDIQAGVSVAEAATPQIQHSGRDGFSRA